MEQIVSELLWSYLHTEAFSPVVFCCLIKCVIIVKQTTHVWYWKGGRKHMGRGSCHGHTWLWHGAAGCCHAPTTVMNRILKKNILSERKQTSHCFSCCIHDSDVCTVNYALPYYIEVWSEGPLSPSHSQLVMFEHIIVEEQFTVLCFVFFMFSLWFTLQTGKRNWGVWMNSENELE